jgi:hypothetical protein
MFQWTRRHLQGIQSVTGTKASGSINIFICTSNLVYNKNLRKYIFIFFLKVRIIPYPVFNFDKGLTPTVFNVQTALDFKITLLVGSGFESENPVICCVLDTKGLNF